MLQRYQNEMETLENQQVTRSEVPDYRWWCGQIQTQMQLWGRPLWLATWWRDVSAEHLFVSARTEKNRCSQENLSVLHLTLFPLEMAWAMSKEESNRKAVTEGASCVTIWAQFSSSDTNDLSSILCWPRCEQEHPCHCSGNHLSEKLQPAESTGCFPK